MNKTVLHELLHLTPAERAELAQDLWDSVEDADFPSLTPEQKAEVDRRLAEHRKDPGRAIPWDVVRERLRARFG
jgi:putative addiction module component (TIGR02574 family)